MSKGFIPPHGGYEELHSYQKALIVFLATYYLAKRWVRMGSRTRDQMEQSARSGKQGSLISMAMIDEFMGPEYDRVAAFAKRHNIPVISVDTDGQVEQLVPAFMKHGVNAMMPFEVQAGNDVVAYRKQYPKLGIMGGLDKSALAKGKPEMHRELDRAEQMLALGGWIPGLDHLVPPDVSWANFTYFVETLRKMVFNG